MKDYLLATARTKQASLQLCTFNGGSNDSAAMAWAHHGIAAGSLTIPRRYSHSPMELADLRDAVGALEILRGVVEGMDSLPDFTFLAGD
ncbi:hypothetical protein ACFSC4_25755 [Deinococcus malanensis]|uniref:hypothetical protein n=1 Tax=Deinococcus malanensis TaxID=1706855 RepID=UPI00363BDCD8